MAIYKGFEIVPTTWQLVDSGEWAVRCTIQEHKGSGVDVYPFDDNSSVPDRDEAVALSIQYGKDLIDGFKHGFR